MLYVLIAVVAVVVVAVLVVTVVVVVQGGLLAHRPRSSSGRRLSLRQGAAAVA